MREIVKIVPKKYGHGIWPIKEGLNWIGLLFIEEIFCRGQVYPHYQRRLTILSCGRRNFDILHRKLCRLHARWTIRIKVECKAITKTFYHNSNV